MYEGQTSAQIPHIEHLDLSMITSYFSIELGYWEGAGFISGV
jgi:hypothetical protein